MYTIMQIIFMIIIATVFYRFGYDDGTSRERNRTVKEIMYIEKFIQDNVKDSKDFLTRMLTFIGIMRNEEKIKKSDNLSNPKFS